MNKRSEYKCTKKDRIIIAVFFAAVIVQICQVGFSSVGNLIEQTIFVMLAFVGLLEIFHYVGWNILVPDFMLIKEKESRMYEFQECMSIVVNNSMDDIIGRVLEEYFHKEFNFLQDCSEDRTSYIMGQLGITSSQFEKLRVELARMRCLPLKNLEDAQEKMKQLIKCKLFVVDLTRIDPAKRTYKYVDYYLNFNDAVYVTSICRELVAVMQLLILNKSVPSKFDKIVIPYDSNLVLGMELGKQLAKPVVHMRKEEGRIEKEKCWDGELALTDKVIIVHDVLVTSKQILHTLNNLPTTCEVIGLFCLVARKEWSGTEELKQRNIPVERVLSLSDDDIMKISNS